MTTEQGTGSDAGPFLHIEVAELTLRKHRNGGKQTVTVRHVNVEGGGQAIVGNVQPGEGRT